MALHAWESDEHASESDDDASAPEDALELERVLADLREANERLVIAGVQMQEFAEAAETARAEADRARGEADAANRGKDEFLAMLGHELRNPLSPIFTALQLLRLRTGDSRELAVIERQAGHLARLVDDLLDISRITRGKIELRREPLALAGILAAALEMVGPVLERRHQQVQLDVAEGLVVLGDAERLTQIHANLLTNASKFSPTGARIYVSAEQRDRTVRIRVRDEGVGIDPEMLDSVFDTFVQQRQGIERTQGGLGLGLAIARNLTRLHGGTLNAYSEGPGRGSEFIVELPLASEHTVGEVRPQPARVHHGHGMHVLIVDDNVDSADMLARLLRSFGYEVETAQDGNAALAIARRFQPEIALLDLGLPLMDGYQLAERMSALELGSHPTFVALTGYGQEADQRRSARAGFSAHLVKPVDVTSLTGALDRAASNHRD